MFNPQMRKLSLQVNFPFLQAHLELFPRQGQAGGECTAGIVNKLIWTLCSALLDFVSKEPNPKSHLALGRPKGYRFVLCSQRSVWGWVYEGMIGLASEGMNEHRNK